MATVVTTYRVRVFADVDGDRVELGAVEVNAESAVSAHRHALGALWDARLDTVGARAVYETEVAD